MVISETISGDFGSSSGQRWASEEKVARKVTKSFYRELFLCPLSIIYNSEAVEARCSSQMHTPIPLHHSIACVHRSCIPAYKFIG